MEFGAAIMRHLAPVLLFGLITLAILQWNAVFALDSTNVTLEERLAILEENLSFAERRLDTALRRTTSLITRADELEREVAILRANLSRVAAFASPSAPESFYVERIRRTASGNYTVALRWRSNPEYQRVTSYAVWFATKGDAYQLGTVANQTPAGVMKARIEGFRGGEDIVFKIIGKNEAGSGKASYREARIQGSAPLLMNRIKVAAAVAASLAVLVVVVWIGLKRRRTRPARVSSI